MRNTLVFLLSFLSLSVSMKLAVGDTESIQSNMKTKRDNLREKKKLLAKSRKKLKRGCYVGLGSTRLKLLSHAANYTRAVFLFFLSSFVIFESIQSKTRQGKMNKENKITSRRHEQGRNIKRDRIHKMYFVSVLHRG